MAKVTVVIPNYNHARFLPERIESVINQTYQDFEILYLDDASTDNSDEVFQQYENHPKMRVIRNRQNSGSPFKQWNKGVREARGEYVWIAEADDFADSQLLEKLVEVLDNNPNVGLAYCQSFIVDDFSNIVSNMKSWTEDLDEKHWESSYVSSGKQECQVFLAQRNTIPNASAVIFRKKVYEDVGYAKESFRMCGDWLLYAKLFLAADVAFIASPYNYFRHHNATVRSGSILNGISALEHYLILDYIVSRSDVPVGIYEKVCQDWLNQWLYLMMDTSSSIPRFRVRRIYRAARNVDRRLWLRILSWIMKNPKFFLKGLTFKLKLSMVHYLKFQENSQN